MTIHNDVDKDLAAVLCLGMRWTGHFDSDGQQPRWVWWPLGSIIGYTWFQDLHQGLIAFTSDGQYVFGSGAQPVPTKDVPHYYKVRDETLPNGDSAFSIKIWPVGDPEPAEWGQTYVSDISLPTGSLLIVAHYVDVTVGDISVTPLP